MASYNNGGSYSYGQGADSSYSSSYYASNNNNAQSTLRRRTLHHQDLPSVPHATPDKKTMVKRLDFMFPKVDSEFTVQTDRGGKTTLLALVLGGVLMLAETITWISQNRATNEHITVDTSLGKRMRVNINITFPELACVDLHLDAMDVAGDSQIDIEDTLVKKQLHINGIELSKDEIQVQTNQHQQEFDRKQRILKEQLPQNYCGPCYGAQDEDHACCQTCDEVLEAYKKRLWKYDLLQYTAEQCIREGRDKQEPKRMSKGLGCNIAGFMTVNRVAGNFHIAMGQGVERDGRHIHLFNPEDAPNFNSSHIIHELSFGPGGSSPLNGITKIVSHEHGTSGLFQYFIKIVPTTYKDMDTTGLVQDEALPSLYKEIEDHPEGNVLETNNYFFTERFRPLLSVYEEHMEDETQARAHVGGAAHAHHEHHHAQNAILPGVFFMYDIYPFSVEITQNKVPFTHLLIRLLATFGGVFTIVKWADAMLYARDKKRGRQY